jgi:hypothetical protein
MLLRRPATIKASPTSLPPFHPNPFFIQHGGMSLLVARQKQGACLSCLLCLFLDAPFLLSNPGGVLKGQWLSVYLLFVIFMFFSLAVFSNKWFQVYHLFI